MDNSNMRVYLGISIALVVLLILVIIIPFSRKPVINNQSVITNFPTPTSVEFSPSQSNSAPADSTGVAEEELPAVVVDASTQKQNLRGQLPMTLSSFSINFNYAEDRFVVTLNDPKDQSRTEFNLWKNNTYPAIEMNQFNFQ